MPKYLTRKLSDKDFYLSQAKRPPRPGKYSQYRGVSRGSKNYPYRTVFMYKGRRYYLGSFETEVEAALAYNKAALAIIGPHAIINDVSQTNLDNTQSRGDDCKDGTG